MKFNYLHAFQHGLMTAFSVERKKAIADWLHLFPSCFDEKATMKRFHLLVFHNSVLIKQKTNDMLNKNISDLLEPKNTLYNSVLMDG